LKRVDVQDEKAGCNPQLQDALAEEAEVAATAKNAVKSNLSTVLPFEVLSGGYRKYIHI
jgi:hypothetical protein